MILQSYDITVQCKPGSKQYITDRLSRSPAKLFTFIELGIEAGKFTVFDAVVGDLVDDNDIC